MSTLDRLHPCRPDRVKCWTTSRHAGRTGYTHADHTLKHADQTASRHQDWITSTPADQTTFRHAGRTTLRHANVTKEKCASGVDTKLPHTKDMQTGPPRDMQADHLHTCRPHIETCRPDRLQTSWPNKITRHKRYMIRSEDEPGPLASTSVFNFIKNVGARSPAPGGGSVSACVAAMGAALGAMVAFMTYEKRQFEQLDGKMRQLIPPLYATMNELIPFIDKDTTAFNDYMAACKLPKGTPEEQAVRDQAMQEDLKKAIQVPLAVMQTANRVWGQLQELHYHV
ncbi:formimidoyltransferase-cyclodeaminase-like isoform X2 [Branchiostoma floridae]|uniref:Formimidoyltransferase-cyclodeaminase-like isoform X2 n=1 Tax=Branchiostoma floridae TaxID=7739 RepID=A0A9J7LFU1_BRAFL|nr:formimidoyltransferase-cyclodeaminase-like isoform X2 [Branchiostoma floridae]